MLTGMASVRVSPPRMQSRCLEPSSTQDVYKRQVVSSLFPDKQKDFVFNISETDTVLVKEIRKGIYRTDMEKLAASIVDLSLIHILFHSIRVGVKDGLEDVSNELLHLLGLSLIHIYILPRPPTRAPPARL